MTDHTEVLDALGSDPASIEKNAGPVGRTLIRALDKAVHIQSGAISSYVDYMRSKHPEASPSQLQTLLDKHFMLLATGSGAGAGAASAIPGIGFFMGAAAVGAESLVFLDAAAFYTVASAKIRGVDITDPERRRSLILVALLGSQGTAIVDAMLGDVNSTGKILPAPSAIARFSAPKVTEINNSMLKIVLRRLKKRFGRAWLGKLMPLGVGAVLGTVANRKLAQAVVRNTNNSFGPLPEEFTFPAPSSRAVIDEDGNPTRSDDEPFAAKAMGMAAHTLKNAADAVGDAASGAWSAVSRMRSRHNRDDQ